MRELLFGLRTFTITILIVGLLYFLAGLHKTHITCTTLKAKGISNIKRGDKQYLEKLDRDHDGIACEK